MKSYLSYELMRKKEMKCKVVCPSCGEITSTASIGGFRHCGGQYNVKLNLLAGEIPKYEKMVAKYSKGEGGEKSAEKIVEEKAKPTEKIVEKLAEKEDGVVDPIIEEKPEPKAPIVQKKKRKKKAIVEEKVAPPEDVFSFGFFE